MKDIIIILTIIILTILMTWFLFKRKQKQPTIVELLTVMNDPITPVQPELRPVIQPGRFVTVRHLGDYGIPNPSGKISFPLLPYVPKEME